MKRFSILFSVLLILVFVTACGNQQSDNPEKTASDDAAEAKKTKPREYETNDESIRFFEIQVEVSSGHNPELKFEIEHHDNGDVEAAGDGELNNVNISDGLNAFNNLYPMLKKLNISQDID